MTCALLQRIPINGPIKSKSISIGQIRAWLSAWLLYVRSFQSEKMLIERFGGVFGYLANAATGFGSLTGPHGALHVPTLGM